MGDFGLMIAFKCESLEFAIFMYDNGVLQSVLSSS